MASERQIAANRRNAQKSTGPKSDLGKKRSGRNAYRHGLSMPMSTAETDAQLKELARQFTGEAADGDILVLIEMAADAELDLARVRRVQTATIERALMQGASRATPFHPYRGESPPEMLAPSIPLPGGKDEELRPADNIGDILAELVKIHRYEKRATGRRDRAIRKIVAAKVHG